jgi:hypothetical protein
MAQVIENASGWYVEVFHGSGPGRSYGVATKFLAEGETLRGDQTRTYEGPFISAAEAEAAENAANQYYDGSDYQ